MYKVVSYINNDGETVYEHNIQCKGRVQDDERYQEGNMIISWDIDFPYGMTPIELGYASILARHLLALTNVIGRTTKKGEKALTKKEIGFVLGLTNPDRFLKKMIELDAIAKITRYMGEGKKEIQYVMNPMYFLKGRTITDELYWLFNESMDEEGGDASKE
ncbi:hypothetical protein [Paenisporosarcina sp. OV554]|uniref:hypothetical protein n=1 Tax=Paenisporosarcina sp. OV554 TaxID=2135694 RepID=UPI000D3AF7B2|nr:hypothetical protein [Paenisporosarcina sp. OV554]PUB18242.1 hypothetical protein C8K15_101447 [Paenisporosarcina sp. OV554]